MALVAAGSHSSAFQEAGKPLKDARAELGRAYDTFTVAAEEAVRQYGEYIPLDISSRYAWTRVATSYSRLYGIHCVCVCVCVRVRVRACVRVCVVCRNPGFSGIVRRFPIGLISMITPFNFPYIVPPEKTQAFFLMVSFGDGLSESILLLTRWPLPLPPVVLLY